MAVSSIELNPAQLRPENRDVARKDRDDEAAKREDTLVSATDPESIDVVLLTHAIDEQTARQLQVLCRDLLPTHLPLCVLLKDRESLGLE